MRFFLHDFFFGKGANIGKSDKSAKIRRSQPACCNTAVVLGSKEAEEVVAEGKSRKRLEINSNPRK